MPKPESCKYMKSHEWVCVEGGTASVGVSDHAQHEITDVVYVELPKLGRKVAQGEAISVIESVKAAFDIYAPVSGEVVAVNEALTKDPALVNRSPHEEGWLFKLKPSKPGEENGLMDFAKYQEFLQSPAAHGASH
ncbi:MAG: glycine cleavage system protein GcvH [Elusimicrobia bacterium]|nr:glycine cleavage system protein GcvH [Elusimicrobiota bacterium]